MNKSWPHCLNFDQSSNWRISAHPVFLLFATANNLAPLTFCRSDFWIRLTIYVLHRVNLFMDSITCVPVWVGKMRYYYCGCVFPCYLVNLVYCCTGCIFSLLRGCVYFSSTKAVISSRVSSRHLLSSANVMAASAPDVLQGVWGSFQTFFFMFGFHLKFLT